MARKITLRFPHQLHPDEVHARLSHMIGEQVGAADDEATISYRRDGESYAFTCRQAGLSVQGELVVGGTEVTVTVEVPWIARLFQGTVEDFITRQAAIVTGPPSPAQGRERAMLAAGIHADRLRRQRARTGGSSLSRSP